MVPSDGPSSVKITQHMLETTREDDRRFSSNFVPVSTSLLQNETVSDTQDEETLGMQMWYDICPYLCQILHVKPRLQNGL